MNFLKALFLSTILFVSPAIAEEKMCITSEMTLKSVTDTGMTVYQTLLGTDIKLIRDYVFKSYDFLIPDDVVKIEFVESSVSGLIQVVYYTKVQDRVCVQSYSQPMNSSEVKNDIKKALGSET